MQEIGYEDCDWVSFEASWKVWQQFTDWYVPLELHVPCRDPLDHLMSQCNFRRKEFDCQTNDLAAEVESCIVKMNRYKTDLERQGFRVRCFDFRQTNHYIEWIGERLQKKRVETDYVFRSTNRHRNKTNECIWKDPDLMQQIESLMLDKYEYYNFCGRCVGSENDIFHSSPEH